MKHSGMCDCGCGQHSIWTILREIKGVRYWFLTTAHLKKWEADNAA